MGKMSIYEDFKKPLMEFVNRSSDIPNLLGVVLFGSAVTGDVSKKSDIDLLLVTRSSGNPEIGEESKVARKIASDIAKKYSMEHSFSFTFYNVKESDVETDFLWEVAKEGIPIWVKMDYFFKGKFKDILKPKFLCSYSLKGLREKNRRAVIRKLYELKSSLISKEKEKVAPGVFLVDAKKESAIRELFSKYGVKDYSIKKVWTS